MAMSHHILIIEDDSRWQQMLSKLCQKAIEPPPDAKPDAPRYVIDVAADETEASAFLDRKDYREEQLSLALLDLNLNSTDEGAEGFELLKRVKFSDRAIVVSGKADPMIAATSFTRYRVLGYISKTTISQSPDDFVALIRLALTYDHALRLLKSPDWQDAQAARRLWDTIEAQHEKMAIRLAPPVDIPTELALRLNKTSNIPDSTWSNLYIQNQLKHPARDHTLYVYAKIIGLEDFTLSSQDTDEDEVHSLLISILKEYLESLKISEYFLGHWRGGYLVYAVADQDLKFETVRQKIAEQFNERIQPYYKAEDRAHKYMVIRVKETDYRVPLLRLEIRGLVQHPAQDVSGILGILNQS